MYILRASTISFQPVFEKENFSNTLEEVTLKNSIQHPNYKDFIPTMALRRMTDFVKMVIANGIKCSEGITSEDCEGIIIGTAIGSTVHTGLFMDKIMEYKGGLVAPTSFILSTHNTAAGQLSLRLKNNNYNNTHVQSTLSFEHSLIDAMMCIEENKKNIIVGAVDESDELLFDTSEKIGARDIPTTFGSSLFLVDSNKNNNRIKIKDIEAEFRFNSIKESISNFLVRNNYTPSLIDKVLFASRDHKTVRELTEMFDGKTSFNYELYTGSYLTSSAFATHIAYDSLKYQADLKSILIVNNLLKNNLGLTLLIKEN